MKKTAMILSIALLFPCVCTAQRMDRIKGNGTVTTEKINTKDYEEIEVSGPFEVILVKGNEGEITVETDENLHEILDVEVVGNSLKIAIQQGKEIKKYKELIVKVPVTHVDEISLTGSGDIRSKLDLESERMDVKLTGSGDIELELECNTLTSTLTGSGDIVLSGTTIDADYTLTGSGDYSCFNMKAKNVDAVISGSGDIELYAEGRLSAYVSGSGDIAYKGNPKNQKANVAGSGSIESK